MKKTLIFLSIVVLAAAVLRLYRLGSIPISLDWDETSLGYNAYSILHTGRDEYGALLPVNLRSFGDYKPALYTYLDIPSVAVFGLDNFAVRLPSALFGIAGIVIVYFLIRELVGDEYAMSIKGWRFGIPEMSAIVLALSPVAIDFSRVAFEAQVAAMINALGVYLFIKGLKRPWLLSLSALSFASSMYTYQSEKAFVPLLVLILLAIFYKQLIRVPKKKLVTAVILGCVAMLPFVYAIVSNPNALSRAEGVSVFNHPYQQIAVSSQRMVRDRRNHDIVGILFDNQKVEYAKIIISNYLAHFNLEWLFVTGDSIVRHEATGMGHLYLVDLPFFLIGLFILLFGALKKQVKLLFILWLLAVPIPASISWDVPNIVRTLNFVPLLQIIIAIGLMYSLYQLLSHRWFKQKAVTYVIIIIIAGAYLFNISYYLDQYFVQFNYFSASGWQYGYKQAVSYIAHHQKQYRKIIVADQSPLDQSYIFFLYNLKYPPQKYQKQIQGFASGNASHRSFDNFIFERFDTNQPTVGKVLYVGSPGDFPSSVQPVYTVRNPDGTIAIELIEK